MTTINIKDIIIYPEQRELNPVQVAKIAEKIKQRGYNPSYPVTIDHNNGLVDGGHRLEAARQVGLKDVPFVYKPDGVSSIRHAILCNEDGADTRKYDVFDYAEFCYKAANKGQSGQQIAEELGWSVQQVTYHKRIKDQLHPTAWRLTRNCVLVNGNEKHLVNSELTVVNWRERHFRALLSHLSPNGDDNRGIKRGQLNVIHQILQRWQKPTNSKGKQLKVTAAWIDEIAKKEAWHIQLKRYAIDNLRSWVNHQARRELFYSINTSIFGDEETEERWEQFKNAIDGLNGKSPLLLKGDATQLPEEIEPDSVDIIITSPPYNLGDDTWAMGGEGRTPRDDGIGYDDNKTPEQYEQEQLEALKELYRVAKPGASFFYNHKPRTKDGKLYHPLKWLLNEDNPWTLRQEIVWDRTSTHNHCPVLFDQIDERIFWMVKGNKPNLYTKSIPDSTIWRFHGPKPGTWHPAPFSEELPRRCLKAIGGQNLTVLDPYAGSCTTLKVALTEFGFNAIGVDKNIEYLEKAKEVNGWDVPESLR